jgi:hypothetical protein
VEEAPQEQLDAEAREWFRQRIQEIKQAKAEIEARSDESSDDTEWKRLDEKEAAIYQELAAATGLGKRQREIGPKQPRGKAADRVRQALKALYKRLAHAELPLLADHLQQCIRRRGTTFVYQPEGAGPDWKVKW